MNFKQLKKILPMIFVIGMFLSTHADAKQKKEEQSRKKLTKQEGTVEPIVDEHGREEFEGMLKAGNILLPGIIKTIDSKIEGICMQLVVFSDPIGHLGGMFANHHLPADHSAGPKLRKLAETTSSLISKYCTNKPSSDIEVDWQVLKEGLQDVKEQLDAISKIKIFAIPH